MNFPSEMLAAKRWMVRAASKKPFSCLPEPANDPGWKYRWNKSEVWASYKAASEYVKANKLEGLSFVLHSGDEPDNAIRFVCLDFDHAFDEQGRIWPEVENLVNLFESFTEYSRSGNGLHVIAYCECPQFLNKQSTRLNDECSVDIFCSAQIAVTGKVFRDFTAFRTIPFSSFGLIADLKLKGNQTDIHVPDWWSEPETDLPEEFEHIADEMETWAPAVKSRGRSNVVFAAACHLARNGIEGWHAVRLLELVPTDPAFNLEELQHKVIDGWKAVQLECDEFEILDGYDPENLSDSFKENKDRIYRVSDLVKSDLKIEFIVEGAFVDRQTAFIAGREKCFKTGVCVDLLLSLATQTDFLGRFRVLEPRNSLFFTAEVGLPAAKNLIERIAQAKGIDPRTLDQCWIADFMPNFTSKPDISALKRRLDKLKPQVVGFDPLYFGLGSAAVGDMYEIGAVLRELSVVCMERDIWPIICHHARKNKDVEYNPMELADMYGSGVSAFARQWLLLSHASPFLDGRADLHVRLGGSATGDLALWRLEINEGVVDTIVASRRWDVKMERSDEFMERQGDVDEAAILKVLSDNCDQGYNKNELAQLSGVKQRKSDAIVARLANRGIIVCQNGKYLLVN